MNWRMSRPLRQDVEASAVDDERRAGDEPRFVRCEKANRRGDVGWLADGARDLLRPALHIRVVPQHRRVHRAWRDGVDADFLQRELLAEPARERLDSALR